MPRAFNVEARVSSFELPALTKEQIKALALDLDLDAREVVIRAVTELWQREIGEGDRDILGELDEIKQRLDQAGL
jgi:hypothetical protein